MHDPKINIECSTIITPNSVQLFNVNFLSLLIKGIHIFDDQYHLFD
jgi:hypothetical protein